MFLIDYPTPVTSLDLNLPTDMPIHFDTVYDPVNQTIIGTEGDDYIEGGDGFLRLFGLGGEDQLNDGIGFYNDYLDGGEGHDVLWTRGGHDIVLGGAGDDLLLPHFYQTYVSTVFVEFFGGEGSDIIYLAFTRSTDWTASHMDDGRVLLTGSHGQQILFDSVETIYFSDLTLDISQSLDDLFTIEAGVAPDQSTAFGDDEVFGTEAADEILGYSGDDWIDAGTGDDALYGGTGRDTLHGGEGADLLDGGVGNDLVYGGAGDDILLDAAGRDVLRGGAGDDIFYTFASDTDNDWYVGGADEDTVIYSDTSFFDVTFAVDDRGVLSVIRADGSRDNLLQIEALSFADVDITLGDTLPNIVTLDGDGAAIGTAQADYVRTALGDNQLNLYGGDDLVVDTGGNDSINLGRGNDILTVAQNDTGNDVINGGEGFDVVEYEGFAQYFFVYRSAKGHIKVEHRDGHIDTLANVEVLIFSNATIDTDDIGFLPQGFGELSELQTEETSVAEENMLESQAIVSADLDMLFSHGEIGMFEGGPADLDIWF